MKNKNNVEYCGVLVSERGAANNRVDSGTLKEIIGGVLADDIVQKTEGVLGHWELVNGNYYMDSDVDSDALMWEDETECYCHIYSYYIISTSKAEFLMYESDEIVLYNPELNMYVWGITYCNISGDDVLTSIRISDNQAA